ncbi:intradiol ring-cleavage dioxygenase [Candidatus Roizmanbacteria bacterium]|nr:intradiol ring-cleavage dioxygenase [Candidatus Roizmanbacteria bacterium]
MKKALLIFGLLLVIFIISYFIKINPKTPSTPDENIEAKTELDCNGIPTPSQTEGPYYKEGSPKRNNIAENVPGEKLVITGFVLNKDCKPIANTWLDFWQADSEGVYDNNGYTLRGHQFTDENGMYRLETIIPAAYGTRPPHIHVKIRSEKGTSLTSQIYFPNSPQNKTDPIFNQELIIENGTFNFVLGE